MDKIKRAYQCSQCKNLVDYDEFCGCPILDPRPNSRGKGDAKLCKENFEYLEPKKQWHEKFYWE